VRTHASQNSRRTFYWGALTSERSAPRRVIMFHWLDRRFASPKVPDHPQDATTHFASRPRTDGMGTDDGAAMVRRGTVCPSVDGVAPAGPGRDRPQPLETGPPDGRRRMLDGHQWMVRGVVLGFASGPEHSSRRVFCGCRKTVLLCLVRKVGLSNAVIGPAYSYF